MSRFVLPVPVSRRQSLCCIKARFKALGSGPSFFKLPPKPFPMRLRQGMYRFLKSLELESCWEWISGVKHVLTDTGYPRAAGNQRNDRVIVADFGFLN